MKTKLGLHVGTGSRNGYGMTAPLSRGIVIFDGGGSMDEIHEDCFRLFRPSKIYEWPPGSGQGLDDIMPGFDQLKMEDMEGQAAYWWPIFRAEIDRVTASNGRIDATQIDNEAGGNDPFQLRKKHLYEKHMGIFAARDGYVITVGNEATDSPHWGEYLWQSLTAPHVVEMWKLGHIYNRHAYADKVDGVNRLIVNGQPAGNSSGRPFKEIEFFKSQYGQCGPIILGEIGFVSYPGNDLFMQEITAYDAYMQQWPEIGYGAIFEYGDWNSGRANIQTASDSLAMYLAANPFVKWEPTGTAVTPPPTGKHKVVIVKLPQEATKLNWLQSADWSYDNYKRTQTASTDDMMTMLNAGNAQSYAVIINPWLSSQQEAINRLSAAGYSWVRLELDYPEPEPPPVVTPPPTGDKIDLLPYIKGDGRLYEVKNSSGSQERFQTQDKGNGVFWQTKNSLAEELICDGGTFIYRGFDTSPGNGRYYVQQQNVGDMAQWLPRMMAINEVFIVSLRVQFYDWNCQPSAANSGNVTDTRRLVAHYDSWTSPYGIALQDVVQIEWMNGGELYWYARGYGLVGWARHHDDPNTPASSAISEVHAPGQRPDNVVNLPDCLR